MQPYQWMGQGSPLQSTDDSVKGQGDVDYACCLERNCLSWTCTWRLHANQMVSSRKQLNYLEPIWFEHPWTCSRTIIKTINTNQCPRGQGLPTPVVISSFVFRCRKMHTIISSVMWLGSEGRELKQNLKLKLRLSPLSEVKSRSGVCYVRHTTPNRSPLSSFLFASYFLLFERNRRQNTAS